MNNTQILKRKLRWKCRRGMLELDIMLANFFDQHYDALNEKDKQLFIQVLEMDDTQLFACLMQAETVQDQDLMEMLRRISDAKKI